MVAGDFKSILDESINKAREEKDVFSSLKILLTLDGRQEIDKSMLALSASDSKLIDLLTKTDKCYGETIKIYCYIRNNKLEFSSKELQDSKNCEYAFSFNFSREKWTELCKQEKLKSCIEYKECFTYLRNLSQNELRECLCKIEYHLVHMAPVIYYVGNSCYSNFDYLNNLSKKSKQISRESLINYWLNTPLEQWECNDYIFVCFTNYILSSGIQTRLEEFNGKQISLRNLEFYLEFKYYQYQKLLKRNVITKDEFTCLSLEDKAKELKLAWKEISQKLIVYREINGLSLQKSEKIIFNNNLTSDFIEDKKLSKLLKEEFGIKSADNLEEFEDSLREYFKGDVSYLEEKFYDLLNFILLRLSEETRSDIAFSRYFGEIGQLIQLDLEKRYQDIVSLNPKNYYCLVTPSKKMLDLLPISVLSQIGMAINSRMLYNGWHYMPGNFIHDKGVNLKNRDFYFSAVFPDLTNKDKYHHVGHVKLDINNCIRVPLAIRVNAKEYRALMDVRIFRRGDEEYSIIDLEKAMLYSKYIKVVGQIIFDLISENKDFSFSLQLVTREKYAKNLENLKNRRYKDEKNSIH